MFELMGPNFFLENWASSHISLVMNFFHSKKSWRIIWSVFDNKKEKRPAVNKSADLQIIKIKPGVDNWHTVQLPIFQIQQWKNNNVLYNSSYIKVICKIQHCWSILAYCVGELAASTTLWSTQTWIFGIF